MKTLIQSIEKVKAKASSSWRTLTLREVGEIVSGGTPSTAVSEYWGGDINWISPSDLTGYKNKTIKKGAKSITNLGLKNSSARLIPKGSVLFSSRAPIGYVVIAAEDLCTNQGFKSIIPHEFISSEYLYYYLSASKQQAEKVASGTTFKEISKAKFAELHISFPDLETQHRIVSKIEELFSELNKGIENLKLAQDQLKVYRQSVLKWAFANNTFSNFQLKDVTQKIQIGPFGTQLHKEDYIENGIPLINPTHIKGGKIVADTSFSILKSKRDSLPNYILDQGDVIMGRRGEMGRCALVTSKEAGWFCGTGSLYFRPNRKYVNESFLYYYLSCDSVKKYLEDNAGGTTMANLNFKIVNEIPIALPSIEEQVNIVESVELCLSVTEKIDEIISLSLVRAEAMKLSILSKFILYNN